MFLINMKVIKLIRILSLEIVYFWLRKMNTSSIMKMIKNLSTMIENRTAVIGIKVIMVLFATEKIILVYNIKKNNNNNVLARLKFREKIYLKDIFCLSLCSIFIARSFVGFTWETNRLNILLEDPALIFTLSVTILFSILILIKNLSRKIKNTKNESITVKSFFFFKWNPDSTILIGCILIMVIIYLFMSLYISYYMPVAFSLSLKVIFIPFICLSYIVYYIYKEGLFPTFYFIHEYFMLVVNIFIYVALFSLAGVIMFDLSMDDILFLFHTFVLIKCVIITSVFCFILYIGGILNNIRLHKLVLILSMSILLSSLFTLFVQCSSITWNISFLASLILLANDFIAGSEGEYCYAGGPTERGPSGIGPSGGEPSGGGPGGPDLGELMMIAQQAYDRSNVPQSRQDSVNITQQTQGNSIRTLQTYDSTDRTLGNNAYNNSSSYDNSRFNNPNEQNYSNNTYNNSNQRYYTQSQSYSTQNQNNSMNNQGSSTHNTNYFSRILNNSAQNDSAHNQNHFSRILNNSAHVQNQGSSTENQSAVQSSGYPGANQQTNPSINEPEQLMSLELARRVHDQITRANNGQAHSNMNMDNNRQASDNTAVQQINYTNSSMQNVNRNIIQQRVDVDLTSPSPQLTTNAAIIDLTNSSPEAEIINCPYPESQNTDSFINLPRNTPGHEPWLPLSSLPSQLVSPILSPQPVSPRVTIPFIPDLYPPVPRAGSSPLLAVSPESHSSGPINWALYPPALSAAPAPSAVPAPASAPSPSASLIAAESSRAVVESRAGEEIARISVEPQPASSEMASRVNPPSDEPIYTVYSHRTLSSTILTWFQSTSTALVHDIPPRPIARLRSTFEPTPSAIPAIVPSPSLLEVINERYGPVGSNSVNRSGPSQETIIPEAYRDIPLNTSLGVLPYITDPYANTPDPYQVPHLRPYIYVNNVLFRWDSALNGFIPDDPSSSRRPDHPVPRWRSTLYNNNN
jgi:hypothetical protein